MKLQQILLVLTFSLLNLKGQAQKAVIDKLICENWPSLSEINGESCLISNDGKFIVFQFGSRKSGNTLTLKQLNGNFEKSLHHAFKPAITRDSKRFIAMLPGDSLLIYDLRTNHCLYMSNVDSYDVPKEGNGKWIAWKEKGNNKKAIVKNLTNNKENAFSSVERIQFNDSGTVLVIKDSYGLTWYDLVTNEKYTISEDSNIPDFSFDNKGKQIAFVSKRDSGYILQHFKPGMKSSVKVADKHSPGIGAGFEVDAQGVKFTNDGSKVLFQLKKSWVKTIIEQDLITADVNVWTYKDKVLQQKQLAEEKSSKFMPQTYSAIADLKSNKIIQLETDILRMGYNSLGNDHALLVNKIVDDEIHWNGQLYGLYLVSFKDGNIKKIVELPYPGLSSEAISPYEKFVMWYDKDQRHYFSYELSTSMTRKITASIRNPLNRHRGDEDNIMTSKYRNYGIAGWVPHDKSVLIKDRTDIWSVDPSCKSEPINITNGYGERHNITFNLVFNPLSINEKTPLILSAFDNTTKMNGFYKIDLMSIRDPKLCVLDNHVYSFSPLSLLNFHSEDADPSRFAPIESNASKVYIVRRMSGTEAPNLFLTSDFKSYKPLTNLHPERNIKWFTKELHTFHLPDGTKLNGILYKPENLDQSRKYPLIFNYYMHRSETFNIYNVPQVSGDNIDIPWYVSRDYLVFEPDMSYTTGQTSKSIIEVANSAVKYLQTLKYVDTDKLGAQGQSFGGYETNVLAIQTNLFKAASEMAGPTNLISEYGSLRPNGYNNQRAAELGQRNLDAIPWVRPSVFIENSPIFHIGSATTPLLMVHNKGDQAILYSQAIELFLGMRRANKKVWLLEYDGEDHSIYRKEENKLDFTIRLQQFFDHYLKGTAPPIWMVEGMPAKYKGIKSGLQLDSADRTP